MHKTIDVGSSVWILNETTEEIQEAKVESHEWWEANPDHPVYYNLIDLEGKEIGTNGTGNFHFLDVFPTQKEAEFNLYALLRMGFKYNKARARLGMPPLED